MGPALRPRRVPEAAFAGRAHDDLNILSKPRQAINELALGKTTKRAAEQTAKLRQILFKSCSGFGLRLDRRQSDLPADDK